MLMALIDPLPPCPRTAVGQGRCPTRIRPSESRRRPFAIVTLRRKHGTTQYCPVQTRMYISADVSKQTKVPRECTFPAAARLGARHDVAWDVARVESSCAHAWHARTPCTRLDRHASGATRACVACVLDLSAPWPLRSSPPRNEQHIIINVRSRVESVCERAV